MHRDAALFLFVDLIFGSFEAQKASDPEDESVRSVCDRKDFPFLKSVNFSNSLF